MKLAPAVRKGQKTKSQILATALRIASREGLSGLTIGELAKAVGMSKSGLFAHFNGKDALQLKVLESAVEHFVEAVMKPAFSQKRGLPRIEALVKNWISFIDGNRRLPGGSVLIAASIELDDRPGFLRDFVQNSQRQLIANVEKSARIAVETGHFRDDLDCGQFAWSLYSYILGYHHFARLLDNPKATAFVWRSFNDLVNDAAAKPGPSKKKRNRKVNQRNKPR